MCFLGCALWAQTKDLTQYVNPLMGTLSSFELSTGNTYPAIARPWGMNFWTPQTGKMGDGWQYVYTAHKIRGFKQTHQPSPWINDYGQFSIMPVVGKPEFNEDKRASWFSHKGEVALPHYYKVYLAEHDVVTEFTPTERAVLFRFTFPENEHSYIVVDAFDKGSYIKIMNKIRLSDTQPVTVVECPITSRTTLLLSSTSLSLIRLLLPMAFWQRIKKSRRPDMQVQSLVLKPVKEKSCMLV